MKFIITKKAYDTPTLMHFCLEYSCSIMAASTGFSTEEIGDEIDLSNE